MRAIVSLAILIGALNMSTAARVWARPAESSGDAERRALFLRGAQLWPVYCNTCHNARPGAEFSPAEWSMIMMHMRTQGNLPAKDARAILEYLRSSR